MDDLKQKQVLQSSSIVKFWGLVRWSLIRHKYYLPIFSIVQIILAVAIVYGFALMTPVMDYESSVYLSSGALTLGIIAVGCVLAPQIVSESKQNGILGYQRSLPVARSHIIIADLIIWSIAALPGIIMSIIAGILRFDVPINISLFSLVTILVVLVSMILMGFSIAYLLPPNMVSLATQLIMLFALLFSPITYPADRLPEWTLLIYQSFPFVPISNLIRATLFDLRPFYILDLIIVLAWAAAAYLLALKALSRKD